VVLLCVYSADHSGSENGGGSGSNSGTGTSLAPVPSSVPPTPVAAAEPPVQQIAMRSLIVTQDASIIIGRGGSHVNEIRVGLLVCETLA
jgi:hypothetical protein